MGVPFWAQSTQPQTGGEEGKRRGGGAALRAAASPPPFSPPPLRFCLFQSMGRKISKTRFQRGQKNKKKIFFRFGGEAAETKKVLLAGQLLAVVLQPGEGASSALRNLSQAVYGLAHRAPDDFGTHPTSGTNLTEFSNCGITGVVIRLTTKGVFNGGPF